MHENQQASGYQQASGSANDGEAFKRWTAKRKAAVVLDLIKGATTSAQIARRHAVPVGDVEKWLETFTAAGAEALRSNRQERDDQHELERNRLHAKIGELTLQLDAERRRAGALLRGGGEEIL